MIGNSTKASAVCSGAPRHFNLTGNKSPRMILEKQCSSAKITKLWCPQNAPWISFKLSAYGEG